MSKQPELLLVEDSETQALRLTLLLEDEGFAVKRCDTAERALEYLGQNKPDLLVVDDHLPGMKGDEFCRLIRTSSATEYIPLLLLTDNDDAETKPREVESGADDYVAKSADADVLVARVRALLRKPQSATAGGESFRSYFAGLRLLVVDDSPTYLVFLQQELQQEGYQVETADSGEAALAAINRTVADCIVVDFVMPGMNGIELCRRLDVYRRSSHQSLPVLMVTGQDSKDDMMRALDAGADDFVSKSSDVAILKARIRALLRRKLLRDEHERILHEFRAKELEVIRERGAKEVALSRALLAEQLERANVELRETQTQLVQSAKMASLGELVAGVAHELNNPLAFVISHVSTVATVLAEIDTEVGESLTDRRRARLAKARERAAEIHAGVERMRQLVTKLRTFSRLDEGEFKWTDLRQDIESTLTLVGHRVHDGIRIETRFADKNRLYCSPGSLNQALMNLITNAIDAVGDEGMVMIETRAAGGMFEIAVTDSGPGIPKDLLDRIFEPFFTTKDVGQGTGLGLAIAYRIVEQHKGRIDVRNLPGSGAEFVIRIPVDLEETINAA